MKKRLNKNSKFDYFIGAVTLLGATIGIVAFYHHSKTRKLKDQLLITENEIAELELEHKKDEHS